MPDRRNNDLDKKPRLVDADPYAGLSTPVLPVRKRLLIVPVIGPVDAARAYRLTERILHDIHKQRARAVVVDLTAVASMDATGANYLVQMSEAARLLGAHVIVTGISRDIAATLVETGANLGSIITRTDLEGGIEEANYIIEESRTA